LYISPVASLATELKETGVMGNHQSGWDWIPPTNVTVVGAGPVDTGVVPQAASPAISAAAATPTAAERHVRARCI